MADSASMASMPQGYSLPPPLPLPASGRQPKRRNTGRSRQKASRAKQDPRPRWQQEPTDSLRSQPRKISTIPLTSPHPLPMNAPAMGEAASVGRLANALEIERDGSAPWEKVLL